MISSDSENPEDLEKAIRATLQEATTTWPITDEDLDRQRKRKIGQFMRSLNSIEFIANQFTRYSFNDMNLFDVVPTLEKMRLEDLKNAFSTFNDESGFTVYTVLPAEKENDIINAMQLSSEHRARLGRQFVAISQLLVGHFTFILMRMN